MEVERNLIAQYEMTDLNSAMNPSQLYKTNWKDADYSTKVAMEKARIALVKQVNISLYHAKIMYSTLRKV
jgi:hypothetical protein